MGGENPYVINKEKYVDLKMKSDNKLNIFFTNMCNAKGRLEPWKLYEVLKQEFKECSDKIIELVKKVFADFKVPVDFNIYCEIVMRFLAIDEFMCKEILFNVLDHNKDKRICETDLFNTSNMIDSP